MKTGSTGAAGAPGPTGAPGATSKVELLTCKSIDHGERGNMRIRTERCTRPKGSPNLTANGRLLPVVLLHKGIVYATGVTIGSGNQRPMLLTVQHAVRRGTYTLWVTSGGTAPDHHRLRDHAPRRDLDHGRRPWACSRADRNGRPAMRHVRTFTTATMC